MEIVTVITKAVFESHVPSAKMPERNESVYNRLKEQFKQVYDMLVLTVVGQSFVTAAEENAALKGMMVRYVCLRSFVDVIRSLDLVLTATGFGIVSTDSMAPASKVRVDALMKECMLHAYECEFQLISMLKGIEGWSASAMATNNIRCLFWNVLLMRNYTTLEYSADNWQKARGLALSADAFLRKAVSDEYMDELLAHERANALTNDDLIVIEKCNRFTGEFLSGYDQDKAINQQRLDAITAYLNTYSDRYSTFAESELYKSLHAERYENKQEHPTFFFVT